MGFRASVASMLVPILALGACTSDRADTSAVSGSGADTVSVIASFYPLAFIAERIGGGRVTVVNLTPPGAEPHDLELSPDQLERIGEADLAVVLGKGFQPSAEKAAETRSGETIQGLTAVLGDDVGDNVDPHVWLDPELLPPLIDSVQAALSSVDPGSAPVFSTNAEQLKSDLAALHGRFSTALANCARRVIVTSHDAFDRLAKRYGLTTEAMAGFSPDDEPSPDRLAELIDVVEKTGVTTVFTEELVSPAVAQTLARETGTSVEVLNPLEGPPKVGDYFSAMDGNLAKLRAALDCS